MAYKAIGALLSQERDSGVSCGCGPDKNAAVLQRWAPWP